MQHGHGQGDRSTVLRIGRIQLAELVEDVQSTIASVKDGPLLASGVRLPDDGRPENAVDLLLEVRTEDLVGGPEVVVVAWVAALREDKLEEVVAVHDVVRGTAESVPHRAAGDEIEILN